MDLEFRFFFFTFGVNSWVYIHFSIQVKNGGLKSRFIKNCYISLCGHHINMSHVQFNSKIKDGSAFFLYPQILMVQWTTEQELGLLKSKWIYLLTFRYVLVVSSHLLGRTYRHKSPFKIKLVKLSQYKYISSKSFVYHNKGHDELKFYSIIYLSRPRKCLIPDL